MKETKIIEETVQKTVITRVTCNFCKKDFGKENVDNEWYNKIEIETTYGSKYDGFQFTGEICDECIDKYFLNKLDKVKITIMG
jgi:hypothetical protein